MSHDVRSVLGWLLIGAAFSCTPAFADDPFAGGFAGAKMSVELVADGAAYSGILHFHGHSYPVKARAVNGKLVGSFTDQGNAFDFTATLDGNKLTLISDSNTFEMSREAGEQRPVNPLNERPAADAGPPAQAETPAADIPKAPAGYKIAATTDSGTAWVSKKDNITNVADGLTATVHDLREFFGKDVVIKGAFQDTKDNKSGGASFTSSAKDKPITGLITCKLVDGQAKISVTYCLSSAGPEEWKKLNTIAATTPPPAPEVDLTRVEFPDGTGSVGIAQGWNLKNTSVCDPLFVTGPDGQTLGSPAFWIPFQTPDSQMVQTARRMRQMLVDNARRLGRPPPPEFPPPYTILEVTEPAKALPAGFPLWNKLRLQQNPNADSITLGPITSAKTIPPMQPGWTTQVLEYTMTHTHDGVSKTFRAKAKWSSSVPSPQTPGAWALFPSDGRVAPSETFDKDLVVMDAMARSLKVNWETYFKVDEERFEANLRANQIAFDERMKDQRRQNMERARAFEEHNRQWKVYENQKSRNAADWIEYAGGYRTMLDARTGERTQVNLSDINGVVNSLNESANDPHRFVQIPLRDERAPLIH